MQFLNDTPLETHVARAQLLYQDILQAIVVVKATYRVDPGGVVALHDEQIPVLLEDSDTDFATIDTEVVPVKSSCDVAILGHARSPDPAVPVASLDVKLKIGGHERALRVHGDRTWVRTQGGFRPSKPAPFTVMPLTYDRAYGGVAEGDDDNISAHFDNPVGRGYLAREAAVAGAPLPNIEEPDDLMTRWDQRPRVAGVAPLSRQSAMRGMRGLRVDLEAQTTRIDPEMFTFAHPRMTLPAYPAGKTVRLTGVRPGAAPWSFALPSFDHSLRVELGDVAYELPVVADTLYLVPDESVFMVLARCTVLYQFKPERLRTLRLMPRPPAAGLARPTTIRALRQRPSADLPIRAEPTNTGLMLPLDELLAAHPMADILETLPLCPSG
jgi:hypothetical protein